MKVAKDSELKEWPHQILAEELVRESMKEGMIRPTVVSPCGAGKSHIMRKFVRKCLAKRKNCMLVVHRKMLLRQLSQQLKAEGIDYGIIASGHKRNFAPVQIAMSQTIGSRMQNDDFLMPDRNLIIWDEIHAQATGRAKQISDYYREQRVPQINFTATPVNLSGVSDRLCIAGSYSDMLDCKAHLPIECYGPDSPDLNSIGPPADDYSETQCDKVMKKNEVFGSVFEHWDDYNPQHLPAINFASSVDAARYYVHYFAERGICTASIDCHSCFWAQRIRVDGVMKIVIKEYSGREGPKGGDVRDELLMALEYGEIKILHNRFILREALDFPFVFHCIITTPMASIATWLQSAGRLLRNCPAYQTKCLQDHGGVIERLGFPNEDRTWTLGATDRSVRASIKKKKESIKGAIGEPVRCKCGRWRQDVRDPCPGCQKTSKRSVRLIREVDGKLVKKVGRVTKFKPPVNCEKIWKDSLYRGVNSGMDISRCIGLAKFECGKKGIQWQPWTFSKGMQLPEASERSKGVNEVYRFIRPRSN